MNTSKTPKGPTPVPAARRATPYAPSRPACPVDLRLDGNEGPAPDPGLVARLAAAGPEVLRRYPDATALAARLADRLGIAAEGVLVTAGADEALDRICRTYLDATREIVVAVPTFEMIPRYARLAGARVVEVPWPGGAFPVAAVKDAITPRTGVVAVVSPNNPTGAVAGADDLAALSSAAPDALLLVDLAYGDFADTDLTPAALALPNAVVTRTLSKAWGLAGLRVGFVAGAPELVGPLRAAGGPYAVAGPSLALADAALDTVTPPGVARVRRERERLAAALAAAGARPVPSQANFVYATCPDPAWLQDGLAGLGIGIRAFDRTVRPGGVRVTCPGDDDACGRVERALAAVLRPEALLLDMDGVIADERESYRAAIRATVGSYGVPCDDDDIARAKRRPGSNNDWQVTADLLRAGGVAADFDGIVARFQAAYAETAARETLIPDRGLLERLAARLPLGIVTGRPRAEAEAFLSRTGIAGLFGTVVAMEDAPDKPDPAPVRLACERLGVARAWLVGDTVNDVLAARRAGVVPLGVVPPGESPTDYPAVLTGAGAGRVLSSLAELEEVLP